MLGYQNTINPVEQGSYRWKSQTLDLVTRDFTFGDGQQQSLHLELAFRNNKLQHINRIHSDIKLPLMRLDPPLIGGIYPEKNEDRILIQLRDIPAVVIDALITVEDRRFYSHHGIDLIGISRALVNMADRRPDSGGKYCHPTIGPKIST